MAEIGSTANVPCPLAQGRAPLRNERQRSIVAFYDPVSNQEAWASNFRTSFSQNPKQDFGVFGRGYTLAANRLTQLLLDAPRFSDYEAWPVVFLYRHALELYLKHVIYGCPLLAAFKGIRILDVRLQNEHRLPPLSRIVEKLVSAIFSGDEPLRQAVARIRETCQDIFDMDPESYVFRYPMDSKGQRWPWKNAQGSPTSCHLVNLRAFSDRMSSVLKDFDSLDFFLDAETDQAQVVYEILQQAQDDLAPEFGGTDEHTP